LRRDEAAGRVTIHTSAGTSRGAPPPGKKAAGAEDQYKAEWDRDARTRENFSGNFSAYLRMRQDEAAGRVRIFTSASGRPAKEAR